MDNQANMKNMVAKIWINLGKIISDNFTEISGMFEGCTSLKEIEDT